MIGRLRKVAAEMRAAFDELAGAWDDGLPGRCTVCLVEPADPVFLWSDGTHICGTCWTIARQLEGPEIPPMPWEM